VPWVDEASEVFERASAGFETMYVVEPNPERLFRDGGPALWSIGVALITEPFPYFLLVTVGLSDPDQGPCEAGEAGYGVELVLRVPRTLEQTTPPRWMTALLKTIARYVRSSGAKIRPHDSFDLQGPITRAPFPEAERDEQPRTRLVGLAFALDPEIGEVRLRKGRVRYLALYGVHLDELRCIQDWTAARFLELVRSRDPLLITDPKRNTWMEDRHFAEDVDEGARADGSSLAVLPVVGLGYDIDDAGRLMIGFHGTSVEGVASVLRRRLLYGRPFWLHTRKGDGFSAMVAIKFLPDGTEGFTTDGGPQVTVRLSRGKADRLAEALQRGVSFREVPWLSVMVDYAELPGDER
jgi:hypothetical protein